MAFAEMSCSIADNIAGSVETASCKPHAAGSGRKALLAALGLSLAAAANCAEAADPYTINTLLPLSGPASFLGQGEQSTLQVLEKALNAQGGINGRPIRFEFKDDQSSPQQAVQLANQLVAQRAPVIIGPSTVAECNAVAPLLKNGPVMYCASPGFKPPVGSYTFTSYVAANDLVSTSLRYLRERGWTKIALLTATDASGQEAAAAAKQALALPENKAVQLVAETTFNPSDVSISAQMERIKSAGPQALVTWTTGSPTGLTLKAIAQADLNIPIVISASNMTNAQMKQYEGFLPKEVYLATTAWPEHEGVLKLSEPVESQLKLFYGSFKMAGLPLDGPSTYIWDAAVIVVDTLRKLGPEASAQQIRDHIAGLKDFAGINGLYDFTKYPQRGLAENDAVMATWDGAKHSWRIVSKPLGQPL